MGTPLAGLETPGFWARREEWEVCQWLGSEEEAMSCGTLGVLQSTLGA